MSLFKAQSKASAGVPPTAAVDSQGQADATLAAQPAAAATTVPVSWPTEADEAAEELGDAASVEYGYGDVTDRAAEELGDAAPVEYGYGDVADEDAEGEYEADEEVDEEYDEDAEGEYEADGEYDEAYDLQDTGAEPTVVGFLCNWCSYAGADKAGAAQLAYPPNVRVVRVMCSGRVDPQFVLTALAKGADGVVILACHPGDCHYKEQNYRAVARHELVLRLLDAHGIDRRRCRFGFISAAEAQEFADTVATITDDLRQLAAESAEEYASEEGA